MEDLELLRWREARALTVDDDELAEEFTTRAADVRSQVTFLLGAGLTEGASEALTALAEEDMVDFCIMVDLASSVPIRGVEVLDEATRLHLEEFLDQEPWHSLAIDNDITVTLAMIEDLLARNDADTDADTPRTDADTPWYRISPQLPVTLANLMDRVNREQFVRFAGELDARLKRRPGAARNLRVLDEIIAAGAHRVGARLPRADEATPRDFADEATPRD